MDKFPSLSSFLSSAKRIEQSSMDKVLDSNTEKEIQRILNESSVVLSVYNQTSSDETGINSKATADFIKQSVLEAVEANSHRVKSILGEIFESESVSKEREEYWINKLGVIFNIDSQLDLDTRVALIEKQISADSDTLNYITTLVTLGEKGV